jgi:hypothetical protein
MRPLEAVEVVLLRDRLRVAEILDDLERAPEREHLAARDVLDEVGDGLQLAVVAERDAEGVLRLVLALDDLRPELREPRLDLTLRAAKTLRELEVPGIVGVRQRVTHDDQLGQRPVQRVARRVRPPVLHRLEHPRHVAPDVARSVAVDHACDPAHRLARRIGSRRSGYRSLSPPSVGKTPRAAASRPIARAPNHHGRTSRYSFMSQSETVAQYRSHSSRL